MLLTPNMHEAIRKVEATRPARMNEACSFLSEEEKKELLDGFHPNHIREGMRELRVGSNKGDRAPNELADLLEGCSLVDPEVVDLEHIAYQCDVLIIGGGGAGASAAIMAQESGARAILATKLRLGDANTTMAQDGFQAADKLDDSPATHYLDVVGGGSFTNTPDLVEALVRDAPLVVQWLESLGCMLEKEADGTMRTVHGGGSSRRRMHYARDQIGKEIMITLRDEVRNRQIPVLEFSPAVELIMDDKGQVAGAMLQNLETGELIVVVATTTILATGGTGRLHFQGFPTTNHYGATADGLAMAYRAGAKLIFIDAMQYHPTAAVYPEQIVGLLVPEKVCRLGAQVLNAEGKQFVYPLEIPDVVAAAIIRECLGRKKGLITSTGQQAVWLDLPLIDAIHRKGTIASQLPALVRQFKRFDLDITREPILVYPALHYQNGGVKIGPDSRTDVPNLYVAGELAGGVHGRNRLVGNSLADAVVFGRRAGIHAGKRAKKVKLGRLTLQHVMEYQHQLERAGGLVDLISPLLLPDYASRANSRRMP